MDEFYVFVLQCDFDGEVGYQCVDCFFDFVVGDDLVFYQYVEQFVVVVQVVGCVDDLQVIGVVVECDVEIGVVCLYCVYQCVWCGCVDVVVDVEVVWCDVDWNDVCVQFVEYVWCDLVCGVVCVIDYEFQFVQVECGWECVFVEFDVVVGCVVEVVCFVEFVGCCVFEWFVELCFDCGFGVVWQFVVVS